jgi:hypothetical protein
VIIRQDYKNKITEKELEEIIFKRSNEIKTVKLGKINFSVDFDDDKFESGGTIAIVKDSIIIISLVPLMGYEIGRIFCFGDTILVLDRLEKTYYYTTFSESIGKYNIEGDYDDIESVLVGRPFVYYNGGNQNKLKKTFIKEEDELKFYFEIFEKEILKAIQELRISEDNLLTENNEIIDNSNKIKISINYNQFKKVDYFIFPHEISIKISNSKSNVNIKVEVGNIIINEEVNADIKIPAKYKEIQMNY